jgi:hypothetical protein
MTALDDFLAVYEAEYGTITAEEMRDATRVARARAVVVRTPPKGKGASRRRKEGPT